MADEAKGADPVRDIALAVMALNYADMIGLADGLRDAVNDGGMSRSTSTLEEFASKVHKWASAMVGA